jgi:single-strand DNA-binding protein
MAERSLNRIMLIGRLGKTAETSHTPSGVAVTKFSLATSRSYLNKETGERIENTDWHNVVAWRRESIAPYLEKGKKVYVEGRIETRSWEDKDGNKRWTTEVIAEDILLLGSRGEGHSATETPEADAGADDDAIPF